MASTRADEEQPLHEEINEREDINAATEELSASPKSPTEDIDQARHVTQHVVEFCVTQLGRCTFASEEAMRQNVENVAHISDATFSIWKQNRCFVSADEPLPLPSESHSSAEGTACRPQHEWLWQTSSFVSSLVDAAIVAPVKWTAQHAWNVATWVTRDVVGNRSTSNTNDDATGDGPPPRQQITQTTAHRPSESSGVIFLPALHGLCRRVLEDLAVHHSYHNIFTTAMWEDYLLESLDIRNGPVVTEFLTAHGHIVAIVDPSTARTGVVPHAMQPAPSTATLFHWISVMEDVDSAVVRWENRLSELKDNVTYAEGDSADSIPQDMASISELQTAVEDYKLVQIQMMKLHGALLGADTSKSTDDCAAEWNEMMEHFPHVNSLLALSQTL